MLRDVRLRSRFAIVDPFRPVRHNPATRSFAMPSDRASREEAFMKNVEMTVDGTMLTIKVDLSKEFGPSASGKTIIIASTEGNVTIPNREEKVGLNVYRKKS